MGSAGRSSAISFLVSRTLDTVLIIGTTLIWLSTGSLSLAMSFVTREMT
jgi:hypothetical protein